MFLGIAIYETLDEQGTLNSYFITPSGINSLLIVDDARDVDRGSSAGGVDVGPLRVYANREGMGFRFVSSRMGGRAFRRTGDCVSVQLEHQGVPLPPCHAGYYGLLLPKDFVGEVNLSIRVGGDEQAERPKKIFLTDTKQMFVSSDFRVYSDQRFQPDIALTASLRKSSSLPHGFEQSTFGDSFGGYIEGLHETSVANLIREINRNLGGTAPQVFICHATSDKTHARKLAHALAGHGIRVWLDEAEIKIGDSLIEKIENGILSSRNLIVVLTQRSVASRWCTEELRLALVRQIGGEGLRVLPALFETCEIPGFLREKAYADFRANEDFVGAVRELASAIC